MENLLIKFFWLWFQIKKIIINFSVKISWKYASIALIKNTCWCIYLIYIIFVLNLSSVRASQKNYKKKLYIGSNEKQQEKVFKTDVYYSFQARHLIPGTAFPLKITRKIITRLEEKKIICRKSLNRKN